MSESPRNPLKSVDHNDFFDNFKTFTSFKFLKDEESASLIFPKSHPIIRNLETSLMELAEEIKRKKEEKEEYYSKKQNLEFIEMVEATFSSEMPKSTRNRTPFANITNHELFKSNKPKLPKAPKNCKLRINGENDRKYGGKEYQSRKKKKSNSFSGNMRFTGFHSQVDLLNDEIYNNTINNTNNNNNTEILKIKKNNFLKEKFYKVKKKLNRRGCSLMNKIDLCNTKSEYNESKSQMKFSDKLKNFLRKKIKGTNEEEETEEDPNSNNKFKQFMKQTKTKNSLIKSLKQRITIENLIKNTSKSKEKNKEKSRKFQYLKKLKNEESLKKSSTIVPPIPISDLSKKCLREQISNQRNCLSKTSTDELKTVKRITKNTYTAYNNNNLGNETKNRNSSSRLIKQLLIGDFGTKDNRKQNGELNESTSEQNFNKIGKCLNSSEFLKSQLIKAKGFNIEGKDSPKWHDKKYCLNLNKIRDLENIYSNEEQEMSKCGEKRKRKIEFPKVRRERHRSYRERNKKYYSISRQLLAGRVAKKLVELGNKEGQQHRKSNSLSRSFGLFNSKGLEKKRKSLDLGVKSKA